MLFPLTSKIKALKKVCPRCQGKVKNLTQLANNKHLDLFSCQCCHHVCKKDELKQVPNIDFSSDKVF